MKLSIIESPYMGRTKCRCFKWFFNWLLRIRNIKYARRCLIHSLDKREAPIASHLLHTQVLDDSIPCLRELGINAGLAWKDGADVHVFYIDYGISPGMYEASKVIDESKIEYRKIGRNGEHKPSCQYVFEDGETCGEDCVGCDYWR